MNQSIYQGNREELLKFISPQFKKILDVGCSSGNFGALVKSRYPVFVAGVESHPEACREAQKKLDQVIQANVESDQIAFAAEEFDCIIFADILEHLYDPSKIIDSYLRWLAPSGVMIFSIPNIRHISVLGDLLFGGEWKYTESGIMDKTHIRFFTQKSFMRLIEECGLELKQKDFIFSLRGSKYLDRLTLGCLRDFLTAQHLFVAQRKS